MVETYTVQNAMKTGKNSPQFGEEYYVKFVESEQTFPLWFKKDPTGTKIEGEINGSKFNKAKKDYQAQPSNRGVATRTGYKDNSDGMRQGMCLNNAANYVNEHSTALVDPKTWAQTVHSYANALYSLGDLGKEEVAETTAGVFGGTDGDK